MANMKNKVNLIGRIGVMPEIQNTPNGQAYSRFTLAINQNYKDKKGAWVESTQWMNLVIWGANAERFVKRASKGMEIAIEGTLQNREYEGKDGAKKFYTDIRVDEFQLLNVKATTNN